ncbi:Hyaluronan and proteoglycan link protein 3 Precursor [Larimichthys crocea]|uniref:Hyaluronan and proteoglycan link protein 3 n=1 Tax=Larimichthys crocea TaxID=215358 RepID=A0A6G0J181_LARCR|nr:Hyaluronan and proteoglycan link protein 3 Precursor [Larimichthys crocea]
MMICGLHTLLLLGAQLVLSVRALTVPTSQNNFFYHDFLKGNSKKEIHFRGVKLHVDSAQPSVFAVRGGNATMPCRFWHEPELSSPREVRVKWSWLPAAGGDETDVLVSIGSRVRSFGDFRGRAAIRCEVVDGLEDKSSTVDLELQGVVFPYQHPRGHYHLSFLGAQQACKEQDSTLATFTQLFQSWKEGLNWCNAGWLADGTVQYPITRPRVPCGGHSLAPGVRSYGRRHRHLHRY